MSENKKEVPEFCIVCHSMYGHSNFSGMCSVCFKEHRAEVKKEQQKAHIKGQQSIKKLEKKYTETDKLESKEQNKLQEKTSKQTQKQSKKQQNQQKQKKQIKKQIKKCATCSKKVGMLGYQCKHCSQQFCKMHRLPQDHECGVDFISLGKKKLKLDNPTLQKKKVQQI